MADRTAVLGRGDRNAASPGFGVGLRSPHVAEVLIRRPDVACFEVHAENFMFDGAALACLEKVRNNYPLSLHGVALSLGSAGALNAGHLSRLKSLVERLDPCLFSEHLAWSAAEGVCIPDLLPLPYTEEALTVVAEHIDQTQEVLDRVILVENPSSYLGFKHSIIDEATFLAELVRRTGCRLLCDVNNVYVTSRNLDWDAGDYLNNLPADAVVQFHLAGHTAKAIDNREVLIDDHASRVSASVWALYREAVARFGTALTIVEWDSNLPELGVLLEEAAIAGRVAFEAREADANTR
jgi:uncharacterized protein (UPF0276 family)